MNLTPFQLKKQRHYFNVLDADRNGVIEQADFEEIGHRFATAIGYQPGEAGYVQFCDGLMQMWRQIQIDADENSDGRVSFDEFLRFEDRMIFSASPEARDAYIGGMTRGLNALALAGQDSGDALSLREWQMFFHGFRMDESQTEESFRHLDTNGDGKLSTDEEITAVGDFHLSNDPDAPGNWVFGRLPAD